MLCLAGSVCSFDSGPVHHPQTNLTARELGVGAGLVTHRQVVAYNEIALSPLHRAERLF